MDLELQRRLIACSDLPSLPSIAARVITLAEDPAANISDISHAVGLDPALATKLLRIANSPFYARNRQVRTLDTAVMLLGLNATTMLALSFSLCNSMCQSQVDGCNYTGYLRRSLLSATAARSIAKKLDGVPPEESFVAAMLSDLGSVALGSIRAGKEIDRLETVDLDPLEVGVWLLKQWDFPSRLTNAISDSSNCDQLSRSSAENDLARCIALSGVIADYILCGGEQGYIDKACAFVHAHWDKGDSWISEILAAISGEIPEIEALFQVDLMDVQRLDDLRFQAKELLMLRSLRMAQSLENAHLESLDMKKRTLELEVKSNQEHLTGLWNRSFLDKSLQGLYQQSETEGTPLSVLFIDLDNFKCVNDIHGHHLGDEVLKHTAQLLVKNTRSSDVAARYGGEEFVVLLPGLGCDMAVSIANRLIASLREPQLHDESGVPLVVTGSLGISTHNEKHHFSAPSELIHFADQALYLAKSRGRNCFVIHPHCC